MYLILEFQKDFLFALVAFFVYISLHGWWHSRFRDRAGQYTGSLHCDINLISGILYFEFVQMVLSVHNNYRDIVI